MKKSFWDNLQEARKWAADTKHHGAYQEQKNEIRNDMIQMEIDSMYDVGGGNGRIEIGPVLDYTTGIDITSPWTPQDIWEKLDGSLTSLTAICLSEEELDATLRQMLDHSKKYLYFYEERHRGSAICGDIIGRDRGEKYTHHLPLHLMKLFQNSDRYMAIYTAPAKVHPHIWLKTLVLLEPDLKVPKSFNQI